VVCVATIAAAWAVRCHAQAIWWATPAILLVAGIVPFLARRQSPPAVLRVETLRQDLWVVLCTIAAVLPLTCLTIGLMARAGVSLPWPSARPLNYPAWVVYQFLYVAVAEEVFFRGYLLSNAMRWFARNRTIPQAGSPTVRRSDSQTVRQWLAIGLSAACFAVAHAVVQGQAAGLLTFLPGLVMGWVFVRTGTLLAPILFHGLANVVWQLAVGR